ncbi:MAG: insulinase family protein [Cyclobacteriaceae bacterium]|nr:insulinase family protein [Cyclobacteriaceae bacterium]
MKNILRALFLALTVSVTPLFGQELSEALPVAPQITKGKLANGLTYYIRKNSKPEQRVELRLAIKAGSILEEDDQQGLAHFTEHMAFNGSRHFKKNELVSYLQSIGVEFGADLNAYTSFDETVYILPIPTDKPGNLEKGFLVLEDWASGVLFDKKEIENERGVVLEEERRGKGADERMNKVALPRILQGSKYADRLPIGKTEILKTFKPETIKRFYADWYRPELMAVVVVGDIDPAAAESLIRKHFEKLKNPAKPRTREYAKVPPRTLSEGLVVTDDEATNHILQIFYSTRESKPSVTVGDYRRDILKGLSGQLLNLRMQELTQKANPPFLFGGGGESEFVHGYESYFAIAAVGKAGVVPAIEALIVENERARKFGFTSAELDRVKKSFLRRMEQQYNEREKTESADHADEYLRNFLSDEPIPGIENEYAYYKKFLDGITLEEVNQYAARSIPSSAEKKLVLLQGPTKADFPLPTNDELLAAVTRAEQLPVTPFEEKVLATSLMASLPAAGKISGEKSLPDIGVTQLSLENGVTVWLKKTDFKNDQVLFSGFRFGGNSLYGNPDAQNAQYAASMIAQMGVGQFTPTDLRKVLAGKTVSVSPRINSLSEGISGQSGSSDVETMLQLTHLYFTSPRKDPELFASSRSRQQAMIQNMLSDPRTVFQDSVSRMLYGNHPRAPRFPRSADFENLSLDRIMEIYKDRFGNASGWTFFLVGSFELEPVKTLVATYLGSLPSVKSPGSGFKDLGVRPVKGIVKKEIRKGKEEQSLISIAFTGEAPFVPEEQLKLQALIDLIEIKLTETLREKLSGVYSTQIGGGLNKNPYPNYSINLNIPCGPENVDKLIAATFAEIQKIKDTGPTADDLNKVKETITKKQQENLKENSYWLNALQRSVELGTNPSNILTVEKRISEVTAKEIQERARKYFQANNYFQAILYPEK